MKEKTIKKILSGKFESLLKSITDEKVKEAMRNGTIITGGCIVSMLLNEDIGDFDIYFKDCETAKIVVDYYINHFNPDKKYSIKVEKIDNKIKIKVKSSGIAVDESIPNDLNLDSETCYIKSDQKGKYKPIVLTSNAITLTDQIQLILRFTGSPEEIHKNYDFVHCKNYWTSWDNKLVLSKDALISILTKELKYQGSLYPVCSMFRLRKFIKRGWNINAGECLKIAWQISKLDLTNTEVLIEQLLGIDTHYFHQLITIMEKDKKENIIIDELYIFDLINKVF